MNITPGDAKCVRRRIRSVPRHPPRRAQTQNNRGGIPRDKTRVRGGEKQRGHGMPENKRRNRTTVQNNSTELTRNKTQRNRAQTDSAHDSQRSVLLSLITIIITTTIVITSATMAIMVSWDLFGSAQESTGASSTVPDLFALPGIQQSRANAKSRKLVDEHWARRPVLQIRLKTNHCTTDSGARSSVSARHAWVRLRTTIGPAAALIELSKSSVCEPRSDQTSSNSIEAMVP